MPDCCFKKLALNNQKSKLGQIEDIFEHIFKIDVVHYSLKYLNLYFLN